MHRCPHIISEIQPGKHRKVHSIQSSSYLGIVLRGSWLDFLSLPFFFMKVGKWVHLNNFPNLQQTGGRLEGASFHFLLFLSLLVLVGSVAANKSFCESPGNCIRPVPLAEVRPTKLFEEPLSPSCGSSGEQCSSATQRLYCLRGSVSLTLNILEGILYD